MQRVIQRLLAEEVIKGYYGKGKFAVVNVWNSSMSVFLGTLHKNTRCAIVTEHRFHFLLR